MAAEEEELLLALAWVSVLSLHQCGSSDRARCEWTVFWPLTPRISAMGSMS